VRPGESIAIGTATDPYQPAERKFGVTRAILEELAQHRGLELGLVTKGTLILRDLALLQVLGTHNRVSICITITTMKTDLARVLEPRAPRPDLRMKVVRQLNEAGIRAGVNCAPILPGITDGPAELEALVIAASQSGAAFVFANPLFLKPCSLKVFLPFLEQQFPHLLSRYRERYSQQAYLPAQYSTRVSKLVKKYCEKHGIAGDRRFEKSNSRSTEDTRQMTDQLKLFD
jgi:DNA repair photolyase